MLVLLSFSCPLFGVATVGYSIHIYDMVQFYMLDALHDAILSFYPTLALGVYPPVVGLLPGPGIKPQAATLNVSVPAAGQLGTLSKDRIITCKSPKVHFA